MMLSLYIALSALLGCSQAQVAVVGAGSTLAAPLLQEAALVYRQQPLGNGSTVTFYGMGSGRGICRVKNSCNFTADTYQPQRVDFAATDSILPASDYTAVPDMQLYPAAAAAVVPVYNLPGLDNLVLSMDVLAQIFYGGITQWNDPAIAALNPSLTLPTNAIEKVARSDNSGTTEIFKTALANANVEFRTRVGISNGPTWGATTNLVSLKQGNLGIISYVAATKFTIGYTSLGEAKESFLQIASLSYGGSIVVPTTTAIAAAVQALGASFGNNGDPASRLTANLENAPAPAWPIVGYTYLLLRKTTPRIGGSCETLSETTAFLKFFYTSQLITTAIQKRDFAPVSPQVAAIVLGRFSEIVCGGSSLATQWPVLGAGSTLAAPLYQDAATVFQQYTTRASVSFFGMGSSKGVCRILGSCNFATDTYKPQAVDFAGSDSILQAADYTRATDVQMYPAVAAAVVAAYNLPGLDNVVLSMNVLARIFYGAILRWNDPLIRALNTGRALPNERIQVVGRSDNSGTTEIFKKALSNASASFRTIVGPSSNSSWGNFSRNVTLMQGNLGVVSYIAATRFSIGYAALGEALDAFLQVALLNTGGTNVISASTASIAAAVQQLGGSFGNNRDVATRLTADLHGARPPAWPIVGYTYFVLRKTTLRAGSNCSVANQTGAFLKFFYTSPAMTAVVRARQFAPLTSSVLTTVLSRLRSDLRCGGRAMVTARKQAIQ